ncbi:unnamed protein product [Adineta ricciae]|uniref:Kinesin motor domain-containing protein n=1 Tax=Adineta ricciae TaxID=249248 RepID=A0A814D0K9_ADIRI|nr:unnamed protein product [Adineta ricciae]
MNVTESEITTKHRESSPALNVYLRIRPFIGNELERGESQNLIDILDDKHIAVRLPPTINNTLRVLPISYNEYEVTRIFNQECTQQELFEQILQEPTDEIFTGSNWLLCTLGLTNSGKTHTMFGTNDDPGLIPQCLQRIFRNVGSNIDANVVFKPIGLENMIPTIDCDLNMEVAVRNYIFKDDKSRLRLPSIIQRQNQVEDLSVEDERYSIWISFFELYNENILDLLVQPKDMKTRKNLRLMQNDHSTIIKNLIQIPVFDLKEAENIIRFGFANRSTSKTNLNEASSRSHAIICITLITVNEFDEEPTMSHIYVCDLAGNEPSTSGIGKQLTETCNINTSLMTFKDCIRVLNENQTSKKQMLVPYRNSVLTSIFRPFFIGRGRTIICCNINPCATFITQTNDLMKFSALAQKTVIVPNEAKIANSAVIRHQRKSKNKGPKRLGRHSVSKEKNMSRLDQTESMNEILNEKSISYWKFCAKKALDILQKQASNRRNFLIERHQERVQVVEYLLNQREQLEILTDDKQSLTKQNEILSKNLRLEQDKQLRTQQQYNTLVLNESQLRQKLLNVEKDQREQNQLHQEEVQSLRKQLKVIQEQFEHLTDEHMKTMKEIEQTKQNEQEREQYLHDEIQRLKRDLGLELYRKQDAEKKARMFEDKFHHEQTEYQKMQYDFAKIKHELKTIQVKYDALQQEMIDIHQNTKTRTPDVVQTFVDRTSTITMTEEVEPPKTSVRSKRRTNDENENEQEIKKPKLITRSSSNASTYATPRLCQPLDEPDSNKRPKVVMRNESAVSTKQTKTKAQNPKSESQAKPKTTGTRSRTKKETKESSPTPALASVPIQHESHSPIYATIQRDRSLDRASFTTVAVDLSTVQPAPPNDVSNATPKTSTFKRIQSFFRATPTSTSSTRTNRVMQIKSTVVAFGSSTPTNRLPPSVVKIPGPTVVPTATPSMTQKVSTPKSKYNLRTRLFNNPIAKETVEKKTQITKKPSRARK